MGKYILARMGSILEWIIYVLSICVFFLGCATFFCTCIRNNTSISKESVNIKRPIKIQQISHQNLSIKVKEEESIEVDSEPIKSVIEIELTGNDLINSYVFDICEIYSNVDPYIVEGVIWVESRYVPDAIDSSGSFFGLMQIGPKWHYDRMDRLGVTDLLDPYSNILVGIDYLSQLLNSGKTIKEALIAYRGLNDPEYISMVFQKAYEFSEGSAVYA